MWFGFLVFHLKIKITAFVRLVGCRLAKGQIISKRPFGRKTSSKIPTKLLPDFCPEIFCSFLGASGSFLSFLGDLVSNIINKEARKPPKASRKPPGRYKKFQGRNPGNGFVGILEETI